MDAAQILDAGREGEVSSMASPRLGDAALVVQSRHFLERADCESLRL
jgi:hypothetical protein